MRPSRLKRDLLLDIDLGAVLNIAEVAEATETQIMMAYSRALRRTGVTLKTMSLRMLKQGILPKKLNQLRKRILTFSSQRNAVDLSELKIWFGLNQLKVKDLRGRVSGQRAHQERDPNTGRFIAASRRGFAVFKSSGELGEVRFDNGYVSRSNKGRTIRVYDQEGRYSREAEVDIYAPMMDHIEDDIFPEAAQIFFRHFEDDLKRRVKHNIHVDKVTRKRIRS